MCAQADERGQQHCYWPRSSSNECDYQSIHAQTILTKCQKYRPQPLPRENAFSGGKPQVRHPQKKTMLTLLQCCVTHAWQGFQQPHGLAPVDGAHLQTDGALLLHQIIGSRDGGGAAILHVNMIW